MTCSKKVVGFLDIGTNSIRLLVVQFHHNHAYSVLNQQKEVVRLGQNKFRTQALQPAAMHRAVTVCSRFAEMARSSGAEKIIAVATSAVREADNQADFLRKIRRQAQLDVHIISGREEARLIYLGVASATDLGNRQALFIDIGGGSTELAVGSQSAYRYLDSLKLGAIRLSDRFLSEAYDKPVSDRTYLKMKDYVRAISGRVIGRIARFRLDDVFGSSGTILNLGDIAIRRFCGRRLQRGDRLSLRQLREVVKYLRGLPLAKRRRVPGLNPDRADVIIGGASILETLLEELDAKTICVSDRSLRDGLVLDFLARRDGQHPGKSRPGRKNSVLQLERRGNSVKRSRP